MKKHVCSIFFLFTSLILTAQSINWQSFTDSIQCLSSPRAEDLNGDGIRDIVIGGGTDGVFSNNGIMAFNGTNGALLWKRPSRNEVFGSAIFRDITNDGVKDVFISGRQAQLLAINGSNGNLLWDYFPYPVNPADSGLYNFYNPQFIDDVNGDQVPDLLVANGGDHNAPAWQTNRPPGHLMVVNTLTGALIAKAVVPDSAETYCSAIVADVQNNGTKWILFGTGGENLGGSFFACPLSDLVNNNSLANSITLATDANRGYIAPASVFRTNSNTYDIFIQSFGGVITRIKGGNFSTTWTATVPGTESSAAPVVGQFTSDRNPDVVAVLFKGIAPSYSDFYQVMLDGQTGSIQYIDSMATLHYPSANAVDLDNNGIDEVVFSLTYSEGGVYRHRMKYVDFYNNTVSQLDDTRNGVNLGCTPLITNLDNDNNLEMVYVVKKDSTNPVGLKGIFVNCFNLSSIVPNAGLAWGSYMGTQHDGRYNFTPQNCGTGSILSAVNFAHPTCNGLSNGSISPVTNGSGAPYTFWFSNGSINQNQTNLPAGTYNLLVTNAQNCYEERTIYLNDPYVISFGGIAAPTCIGGNNGTATLNSSGCYCMFSTCTFLWENGVTTKPNYNLVEGWNSVIINHPGPCVVVDSVFIPSPALVIDSSIVTNAICFGDSNGSIEVFPSPGISQVDLSWSTGDSTTLLSNLSVGAYTLFAQDSRPCYDTLYYNITQPDSISFTGQAQHVMCHGENTGEIGISSSGGNGGYTVWNNGSQSSGTVLTNLSAGQYSIQVTDSMGCASSTQVFSITEPAAINSGINGTAASGLTSLDGMASVNPTGGVYPYSYLWSDPNQQTDSLAIYLNPGWYTAVITDANGCELQDSIYIGAAHVNDLGISGNIVIYPNPTAETLNLLCPESWMGNYIDLIGAEGKILQYFECNSTFHSITVDHLAGGLYILRNRSNGIGIQFVKE